ncbi:MAG: NmrA family NAD(P)-binding protein [Actinobacteria bacterium]|nr:NmrA family NAD(P)-binding protein [Actinomycetota bacterium]
MTDVLIGVTGATGEVGGRVARALSDRGERTRLVVRDAARAPRLAGAEIAVAEYGDGPAMRRAVAGVDVLFLVSGSEAPDRLEQHRTAVRAIAEVGVGRVVYTSFLGAAPDATFTLARDHFHTEAALAEAGLARVALRDSLYADVLPYLATDGVIRGPGGAGRVAPVARADVADAAVAAVLDPACDGVFDLTGPELHSLDELAAIVSEVTGTAVRYEAETVAEAYASRAGYGAPDWQLDAWVSTYQAIANGELAVVSDGVERLTGHPAMTVREALLAGSRDG